MRYITIIIALIGALTISGCSNVSNVSESLPTLAQLPAATTPPPTSTETATPTVPPTTVIEPTTITPSVTITPPESSGEANTANSPIIVTTRTRRPIASPTPTIAAASPTPVSQIATPLPAAFSFGQSVEGHALEAFRFGSGPQVVMLVGGIHAGFEVNTIELIEALKNHFESTPNAILPGITMILIPSLNPDGVTRGRQISGRFNGNGVDLNRNWGCGWSADAEFHLGTVEPGQGPFSEPETLALGSLIQQVSPSAVIFYHGAANGVYAGECDGFDSDTLAMIYGNASGYPYGESFGEYTITGSGPSWVASQGIPSLDVELATATGIEFERNLRAVMAVQRWLLGQTFD